MTLHNHTKDSTAISRMKQITHAKAIARMQQQYYTCNSRHVTALSPMPQQYHACNSNFTHATAISCMKQQACDSPVTHSAAISRMQQHFHACNSSITHATQHHACNNNNSIVTHAKAISHMQQHTCNVTHAVRTCKRLQLLAMSKITRDNHYSSLCEA